MNYGIIKGSLLATTIIAGLTVSAPAFAQAAASADPATAVAPVVKPANAPATAQQQASDGDTIIVTGSFLRRTTTETPSPVTIVTTQSLDQRGINTIQEGIQKLASNNGPALTNSFTANGAFAGGASAVSLRGLSTNSTLVLFDGQRAAYYPLADDGARNFVDLNTIPDDIVERIEVLRDGASSSYGADAIAGVVNIITKKSFNGIQARGEAGISSRGDAAQHRLSLTAGVGDLKDKGFNAYISGFYYDSKQLFNRDRPYPYNSDDLTRVCFEGTCGSNNIRNGVQPDGSISFDGYGPFSVRPRVPTGTPTGTRPPGATGAYQLLNGCRGNPSYTLTPDQLADPANAVSPNTVCQQDLTNLYGVISPNINRFGVSGRVSARIGDHAEAYAQVNFLQTKTDYSGFLPTIRGTAPTGILFPRFSTSGAGATRAPGSAPLALPVYVCAAGVGKANGVGTGCDATNGVLNPQNPFASQGYVAQILGNPPTPTGDATRSRVYRGALGIRGTVFGDADFTVEGTAMHTDLQTTNTGYYRIQNLLDAIARGQYNFIDPLANSQSVLDFVAPKNINNVSSDLYSAQATIGKSLLQLPGGALQLGVGAQIRYEAVNDPSGNPDYNGPTQRYFTLNAFGAKGHRTVSSAYFELSAPILRQVTIDASGRYDRYSTGQSAFSPKIGFKVTPFRQLALRGTYSRGFRIPSFAEANALPTTGYVTTSAANLPNSFLAPYGCTNTTIQSCPNYVRSFSYGLTTIGTPGLKPEKSRSFTAGAIFEPIRNVSFTVDYYNIKKTGAITGFNPAPAIAAFYAGQPAPAGVNVIADSPDPNFPNAAPRLGFVEAGFVNANTIKSSGLDFGATLNRVQLPGGVKLSSSLDASYIINLSTSFPDGTVERYDGTLGNFNLTAGSGTPKWHGNWSNTFDFGRLAVTGSVDYFGGYNLSAQDQGNAYRDCGLSDGSVPCNVKPYITADLVAQFKIGEKYNLYLTMLNIFDRLPPLDPITYGAHLYNPVQGGTGIYGRYFKAGVKLNF